MQSAAFRAYAASSNLSMARAVLGLTFDELLYYGDIGETTPVYDIHSVHRDTKKTVILMITCRGIEKDELTKIAREEFQCTLSSLVGTLASRALLRLGGVLPDYSNRK